MILGPTKSLVISHSHVDARAKEEIQDAALRTDLVELIETGRELLRRSETNGG
jgi:hypothetical protein